MPTLAASERRQVRRSLDRRFEGLRPLVGQASVPRAGWARAVREALGLSRADLGLRMGVSETSVLSLERGEPEGRVRLDTLRRAADALGCDLVYALVPRQSLEQVVQDRARHRASTALATVEHSMRLEDQQLLPDAAREMLDEHAARLVDRPGLWRDD